MFAKYGYKLVKFASEAGLPVSNAIYINAVLKISVTKSEIKPFLNSRLYKN
jgi:hypothetical protein